MLIDLHSDLSLNAYPGRGLVLGRTADGTKAVAAYFIMGRSENSRNRVFEATDDGIRTRAYDESKVTDPSLIIYHPVRVFEGRTIVTNGDQTDTIRDFLRDGKSFEEALCTREFEPDTPNYTPRISGILNSDGGYELSILKSAAGDPSSCRRQFFCYENPLPGEGHFIHTYACDGDPLPSYSGEPKTVGVGNSIDAFTKLIWDALNEANKISLFVRFIDLATGEAETRILNKYE